MSQVDQWKVIYAYNDEYNDNFKSEMDKDLKRILGLFCSNKKITSWSIDTTNGYEELILDPYNYGNNKLIELRETC